MNENRTVTISSDSVASLPAGIPVNKLRWFRFYPKWPLIWLIAFGIAAWATATISLRFAFLSVPLLVLNVLYWIRLKEHYSHGCATPAVVVQVKPTLIAVYTDMSKGVGFHPMVRVAPLRLGRIMGQRPDVGMRLPTASTYRYSADDCEHWSDFFPFPIECANSDEKLAQELMEAIPDIEWRQLDRSVKLLSSYEPGLYRIDPSFLKDC